jgi:hypothetical protein
LRAGQGRRGGADPGPRRAGARVGAGPIARQLDLGPRLSSARVNSRAAATVAIRSWPTRSRRWSPRSTWTPASSACREVVLGWFEPPSKRCRRARSRRMPRPACRNGCRPGSGPCPSIRTVGPPARTTRALPRLLRLADRRWPGEGEGARGAWPNRRPPRRGVAAAQGCRRWRTGCVAAASRICPPRPRAGQSPDERNRFPRRPGRRAGPTQCRQVDPGQCAGRGAKVSIVSPAPQTTRHRCSASPRFPKASCCWSTRPGCTARSKPRR